MTRTKPRRWVQWLALTEYWYNTNYHLVLETIPFQAFAPQYGFKSAIPQQAGVASEILRDHESAIKLPG